MHLCTDCTTFRASHLDVSLSVWAQLALAQQFGSVGGFIGLLCLSVLLDVGPGPHVTAALDVDLQNAVEAIRPPDKDMESKKTSK